LTKKLYWLTRIIEEEGDDVKYRIKIPSYLSSIEVAAIFMPFFDGYEEKEVINKDAALSMDLILEAIDSFEECENNGLARYVVIGDDVTKLYENQKAYIEERAYQSNRFPIITDKHHIYFSMMDSILNKDYPFITSDHDVMVIKFSAHSLDIFMDGNIMANSEDIFFTQEYLSMITSSGFSLESFSLGKVLFDIKKYNQSHYTTLLNNLESRFVRSLITPFSNMAFDYILIPSNEKDNMDFLKDILDLFNFDVIKDYTFSFVRKFMVTRHG